MAKRERLKKKLLRQAVKENLDLVEGAAPRPRRGPGKLLRWSRRLLLVVLPLAALGASSYVLSRVLTDPGEVMVVTQVVETPVPAEVSADGATGAEEIPWELASLPAPDLIEPSVLRLGVQRIVLDPGHGGANVGTVAPGGIREKDVTLDVGLRLRRLLEEDSFEVLMTREDDSAVGLEDRTRFANDSEADIFVSIHVNWIETQHVRGVETYFLGPTDDPYLKEIAAAENTGSGYSLADFRRLVEGLYAGVRQDESRRLAGAVQQRLHRRLREINPQLRNRGVKTAPFLVLVSTQMPAVLVEVSCLSNAEEVRLLAKPYYRQYIAKALAAGIRQYADSLTPPEESPTPPEETASLEAAAPEQESLSEERTL